MTWDEYLKRLQAKNPQLTDPDAKMTLSVASFLTQLERAYAAGRNENAGVQLFDQLFGGSRK